MYHHHIHFLCDWNAFPTYRKIFAHDEEVKDVCGRNNKIGGNFPIIISQRFISSFLEL